MCVIKVFRHVSISPAAIITNTYTDTNTHIALCAINRKINLFDILLISFAVFELNVDSEIKSGFANH